MSTTIKMNVLFICLLFFFCSSTSNQPHTYEITGITDPDTYMLSNSSHLFIVHSDGHPEERKTVIEAYTLNDIQHAFTLGGFGEVPGKFKVQKGHAVRMKVLDDRIIVNSSGKVSYFSADGNLIKELSTPGFDHYKYYPLGENYIARHAYAEDGQNWYEVCLYGPDMNIAKRLVRNENSPIAFYTDFLYDTDENFAYVVGRNRDFDIDVYGTDGSLVNSIHLDYKRIPPSEAEKEALLDIYRSNPAWAPYFEEIKQRLIWPEKHQAVNGIFVKDNLIYVMTKKRTVTEREFYILEKSGKLLDIVMLPFTMNTAVKAAPYVIQSGKLYQLVKSDKPGVWNLNITLVRNSENQK